MLEQAIDDACSSGIDTLTGNPGEVYQDRLSADSLNWGNVYFIWYRGFTRFSEACREQIQRKKDRTWL